MKIIKPISITQSMFVSNVAASSETAWSSGSTYTSGDTVVADNADGIPHEYTWLPPSEDTVSATSVYPPLTHFVVKRSDMNPDLKSTAEKYRHYWLDNGPSNKYACVSKRSRLATNNTSSIELEITPGELFDSIALINLSGTSVTVFVDDPVEGEVYDSGEIDLLDHSNIFDEYDFCFAELLDKTELVITDLPAYPNATIEVNIYESGETVTLGEFVTGVTFDVGTLLYDTNFTFTDYSDVTTDDSGITTLEVNTYAREISYPLRVNTVDLYYIQQKVMEIRATPVFFIGVADRPETNCYGIAQNFSEVLKGPIKSDCTLKAKELSI